MLKAFLIKQRSGTMVLRMSQWCKSSWSTHHQRTNKTIAIFYILIYTNMKSIYLIYFLTICTTSSSTSSCSFPTLPGLCFTEVPQTKAYFSSFKMLLCKQLQKSSIVVLPNFITTGEV
eukprot:NODE_229_length_13800_cov_0.838114.p10 type:complete len:118 gc:universal NODE_229_length_13800_cov_0.838114:6936-7289(+)